MERRDSNHLVSDEAAEWLVCLRDGDLNIGARRRYVRWLKYSPSHISEFLRVARLYRGLRSAKLPMSAAAPSEPSNVIELARDEAPK